MDIGNEIKKRRTELGLTQEELAGKLGVGRTTISNYEQGRSYPDLQMIVTISDVLGVSLDQLLRGDEILVQKITEDTAVRKTQGKSIRKLKTIIIALAVVIAVLLAAIFLLQNSYQQLGQLTDREEISEAYIGDDDILHIGLDLPKSVEISGYAIGDMAEYGISNTLGISISLSRDWLAHGDLKTSIDLPVYTEQSDEINSSDFLSSEYIEEHDIERICVFYQEVDAEDEIHIHEIYSISLGDRNGNL